MLRVQSELGLGLAPWRGPLAAALKGQLLLTAVLSEPERVCNGSLLWAPHTLRAVLGKVSSIVSHESKGKAALEELPAAAAAAAAHGWDRSGEGRERQRAPGFLRSGPQALWGQVRTQRANWEDGGGGNRRSTTVALSSPLEISLPSLHPGFSPSLRIGGESI